jgi:signal transduction histidine kinase
MTLRTRLALGAAGLAAGCAALVLAVSWWLVDRQLARALPAEAAADASGALAAQLVLALAGCAQLALGGGWLLADRAVAPLRRLAARVRHDGPPDALEALEAAVADVLERQRRFAANAGHELRTPLTAIRAEAEVALDDPAPDWRATAHEIVAATERTEALVDGLLALAAGEHGPQAMEPVDLAALAGGGAPVVVRGDRALLERAATNLLDNARRHGDGRVAATARRDGRQAVLRVENGGAVLAPADVARLGRPFERLGRRGDGGSGLGLSVVRAVATAHGGALHLAPRPGGGLVAEVRLPALGRPQAEESPPLMSPRR